MSLTKFFINGNEKTLLAATINRQGERGSDQGTFCLPSTVNACSSDCVSYLQDVVNLKNLKLYLPFDDVIADESGFCHHGSGFDNIPTAVSRWELNCNLCASGRNTDK